MYYRSISFAALATLLSAHNAFADEHRLTINQTGENIVLDHEQSGLWQTSDVTQNGNNIEAKIKQSGSHNESLTVQSSATKLKLTQSGETNKS